MGSNSLIQGLFSIETYRKSPAIPYIPHFSAVYCMSASK